jgi:hypothetical protein
MPKDDPLVCLHEILPVLVNLARRRAAIVECEHPRGNPLGIKPVADRVSAKRCGEDEDGVEPLAAMQREGGISTGAEQRDGEPDETGRRGVSQEVFSTFNGQRSTSNVHGRR